MNYGARSSIGCIRLNNQDSFHIPSKDDFKLFVVADGMGGTNGGEIASTIAINAVCTYVKENLKDDSDIPLILRNAINEANKAIYRVGRMQQEYSRMGTTCSVALIKDGLAFIAHVGDSRVYLLSNSSFRQITTDHSYVQELVNAGQITSQQAKDHPERHKITRAVGISGLVIADVFIEPLSCNDVVLLCSDGLTSMVDDTTIAAILRENDDPHQAACELINAAEKAGGYDNITAVIIKID